VTWAVFVWAAANAARVWVFYTVLNRTLVLVVKSIELWYTESATNEMERG